MKIPKIPINPPKIHDPSDFLDILGGVLRRGELAKGEYNKRAAAWLGQIYYPDEQGSTLVSNGTAALELALRAVGVKKGSAVITTPYTYKATFQAIEAIGATPIFADIGDDLTIDIGQVVVLAEKWGPKAIVPVDIYGIPANVPLLKELFPDIWVVEDAAQALGAEINGKLAGLTADLATFSFYATKTCGIGEGGAVVGYLATLVEKLKDQEIIDYDNERVIGGNYRMPEIMAAALYSNLHHLNGAIARRRFNAEIYRKYLNKDLNYFVDHIPVHSNPSWHLYPIRWDGDPDKLSDLSFEVRQYYVDDDYPSRRHCARHQYYRDKCYVIPVHDDLQNTDVDIIVEELNNL